MKVKSAISDLLGNIGQIVVASILWAFCCFPVFTIGAASTALYYSVVKVVRRGRSNTIEAFFQAFKANFWQATNWNLILLSFYGVVSLLAVLRIRATGGFTLDTAMGGIIVLALLAAWLIPFVYPVISRFFHKGTALLRFVLYIAVRFFWITLICLVLLAGAAYLCLYNSALLMFLPGLYALLQSFLLEPVFKSLSENDGSDNYSEWYDEKPDLLERFIIRKPKQ